MLKKCTFFMLFFFAVLFLSGCGTVKGTSTGLAYAVQGVCDDTVGLFRSLTGAQKWQGSQTIKETKAGLGYAKQGIESDLNMSWGSLSKTDQYLKDNLW